MINATGALESLISSALLFLMGNIVEQHLQQEIARIYASDRRGG